jgi:two-component system response regulator MprA
MAVRMKLVPIVAAALPSRAYGALPHTLAGLLARRRRRNDRAGLGALRFADLTLDPLTREVRRRGRLISLTPTEFDLLELFMQNSGVVLTRSVIFGHVWGFDLCAMSNSLNVYVGYLRRKTEAHSEPRLIHTVRGVGYVLRAPRSFSSRTRTTS